MSRNDSITKAYHFFIDKEKNNEEFSIEEILASTGWKIETFNTYISKRWKPYITKSQTGKYLVKGIMKLTLSDFLSLQTQVKNISNIDIDTQKLLDSFSQDRKELIFQFLNKIKEDDFPLDEFEGLKNLIEDAGSQNNTIYWEMPDELKTGFQQYLNFFSDFVKKLTGKEISFEISKVATGLKLTVESTSLPIIEIDNLLIKYVNYFAKTNENLISNDELHKLSQMQVFEYKQLIRDLEYEKQNLFRKIEDLYEKQNFLVQTINNLNLRISFFENHTKQLLQLEKQTDSHNIKITFSPVSIQGNVESSILGNINTTEFTQTKTTE